MSAPQFIAKGTKGQGTGASVNFTYMGGIQERDMLFLYVMSVGNGAITVDASWELVVNGVFPPGPPTGTWRLYKKLATGAEAGAEAVTRAGHSGTDLFLAQVYQMRSPVGVPTVEATAYLTTGSTNATITWSAVTVSGTQRTLLAFAFNYNGAAPATPAGYTEQATDNDGSSYLDLNVKENVISGGAVTAANGSANGWTSLHLSMYSMPNARSFIVN